MVCADKVTLFSRQKKNEEEAHREKWVASEACESRFGRVPTAAPTQRVFTVPDSSPNETARTGRRSMENLSPATLRGAVNVFCETATLPTCRPAAPFGSRTLSESLRIFASLFRRYTLQCQIRPILSLLNSNSFGDCALPLMPRKELAWRAVSRVRVRKTSRHCPSERCIGL